MRIGRLIIETRGKIYGAFVAASIITGPSEKMLFLRLKKSGLLTLLTETMSLADKRNFKETLLRGMKEEIGVERSEVTNIRSMAKNIRSKNEETELKGFELFSCELTTSGAASAMWLANEGVEDIVWLRQDQIIDSDLDGLARDAIQLYKKLREGGEQDAREEPEVAENNEE